MVMQRICNRRETSRLRREENRNEQKNEGHSCNADDRGHGAFPDDDSPFGRFFLCFGYGGGNVISNIF